MPAQVMTAFSCQPQNPKSILTRRSGCWSSGLFQRVPTRTSDVPALMWVCVHPHCSVHPYQGWACPRTQPSVLSCSPRLLLVRLLTQPAMQHRLSLLFLISFLELDDTCSISRQGRLLLTARAVVFM